MASRFAADSLPNPTNNPAVLGTPISISRVQSAATAGTASGTLVVTYTIANNLTPLVAPQFSPSATITATLAQFSAFNYADDPNTLRGLLLGDALTASAGLVSGSPVPDKSGLNLAYSLPDLPPLSRVSVVLTLSVPASSASALSLDSGLIAWGTLRGRLAKASAPALSLAPDALAGWLGRTVDADTQDSVMLDQLGALDGTPAGIFGFVSGLGFEAYKGALRGTRGTLWSGAGNSLDKSSLLIAMLRASAIPARYRHGALDGAHQSQLVASMFSAPGGALGLVPAGDTLSDPAHDPALLAAVADHWWVQANLGGTWTDLDPSFANAAAGQYFASSIATDGTDLIPEVPDMFRHKITLRVKTERADGGSLFGTGFAYEFPLSTTLVAESLVGVPVSLQHLVKVSGGGGSIFSSQAIDYVPFLILGDRADLRSIDGQTFQDQTSTFGGGLANTVHTAEWLEIDLRDADGSVRTVSREIADRLGYAARQSGTAAVGASAGTPLVSENQIFQILAAPSRVPASARNLQIAALMAANQSVVQELARVDALQPADVAGRDLAAREATKAYRAWAGNVLSLIDLTHYIDSDQAAEQLGASMLVKPFVTSPRIIIATSDVGDTGNITMTLDLLVDHISAYAYPAQSQAVEGAFQAMRGYVESSIEGTALSEVTSKTARTTYAVFEALKSAANPGIFIAYPDDMTGLAAANISDLAKARIAAAVAAGKIVIAPNQMVTLGGVSTIGWWEKDPATGEVIGVMQDGLHQAIIEYTALSQLNNPSFIFIGFWHGFTQACFAIASGVLSKVAEGKPFTVKDVIRPLLYTAMIEAELALASVGSSILKGAAREIIDKLISSTEECFKGDCPTDEKLLTWAFDKLIAAVKKAVVAGEEPPFEINFDSYKVSTQVGKFAAYLFFARASDPAIPPEQLIGLRVQVDPARAIAVTQVPATAAGANISASLQVAHAYAGSPGSVGLYAAVPSGLGVGGAWPGAPFANFGASGSVAVSGANLILGPGSGTLTVGGAPFTAAGGVAMGNATGTLQVSAAGVITEKVNFLGSAQVFALSVTPMSSTITPLQSATFGAQLAANFSGDYTMTVEGAPGWRVALDAGRHITATPPLGATPGDYTIAVTAQSVALPRLQLTVVHTVTLVSVDGAQLTVLPDPLTTVPWGPGTVSGQLQLTQAAYRVVITNTGNLDARYDVTVWNLPVGWSILNNSIGATTTVALRAGATTQLGLYVSPTLAALPPVGSAFPFSLTAVKSGNAAVQASAIETFVVPGLAFAALTVAPDPAYGSLGFSTTLATQLSNAGNVTATFAESITLSDADWSAAALPPVSLAPGQAITRSIVISTASGAVGTKHPLQIMAGAGGQTATTYVSVHMLGPTGACSVRFAAGLEDGSDQLLGAAASNMANAISALEAAPGDLALRTAAVMAIRSLVVRAAPLLPAGGVAGLTSMADGLASDTNAAQVTTRLGGLCAVETDLAIALAQSARHRWQAQFTPATAVSLPGRPVTYTFDILNRGSETSTYTVTLGSALLAGPVATHPTLAVGAHTSTSVSLVTTTLGLFPLFAVVVSDVPITEGIGAQEHIPAALLVVDRLAQVVDVSATPGFVETGSNITQLSARIANVANVAVSGLATTQVFSPDGSALVTTTAPLNLTSAPAPQSVDLGPFSTAGLAVGVYTISFGLAISTPTNLAGSAPITGFGTLAVGQGLIVRETVSPTMVPPGNSVITDVISTERVNIGAGAAGETGTPLAVYSLTISSVTNASTSDPTVGVSLTLDAGTYDAVLDDGAYRIGPVGTINGLWRSGFNASVYVTTTLARAYPIAQGTDFVNGGSATVEEARALNQSASARIYLPAPATVYFWIPDGYGGDNAGALAVSVRKMVTSSTALNRQVEGALAAALPAQEADTLAFNNWSQSNSCMACHIQTQSMIGHDAAHSKVPHSLGDARVIDAVRSLILGSVDNNGVMGNGSAGREVAATGFALWALARDSDRAAAAAPAELRPPGIRRYEESHPALRFNNLPFNGGITWARYSDASDSGGYLATSRTAGDSVSLTFDGRAAWVGFIGQTNTGLARVFVDGVVVETLDTYRTTRTDFQRYYGGLVTGTHTISVSVLGTHTVNASENYVVLDYFDVWDGSDLAPGRFEEDDPLRVAHTEDWGQSNNPPAIGGKYFGDGSNIWFFFGGDSATIQTLAGGTGQMEVIVDGQSQSLVNVSSYTYFTRTFSFAGFGPGGHVMQVRAFRGNAVVDAFIAPGTAPFITSPPTAGITRREEVDSSWTYNGAAFVSRSVTWALIGNNHASGGAAASTTTMSDTASTVFSGTWANLGLVTGADCGLVQVALDGVDQGTLDTYSRYEGTLTRNWPALSAGAHTLTLTALGANNGTSFGVRVTPDYLDVWDGSTLPAGEFGEGDPLQYAWQNPRVIYSNNWATSTLPAAATNGTNAYNGTSAWFSFSGDSVTFRSVGDTNTGLAEVLVDGRHLATVDNFVASAAVTRTWSFNGLDAGPHMLQVQQLHGGLSVDGFAAPGVAPFYAQPTGTGIVRHEESDSLWRYSGTAYPRVSMNWSNLFHSQLSGGWDWESATTGATATLTFSGTWLMLGLNSCNSCGNAAIAIDGVLQGVIDTYTSTETALSRMYSGLSPVTHTLTITVLGTSNASSNGSMVMVDYADTWDGAGMPTGVYQEADARINHTTNWIAAPDVVASGGSFYSNGSNAWFPFTGGSATIQAYGNTWTGVEDVLLDGVFQGTLTTTAAGAVTQTYSLTGLPTGPHVMQIHARAGSATLDAFVTPAGGAGLAPIVHGAGLALARAEPPVADALLAPSDQTAATVGQKSNISTALIAAAHTTGPTYPAGYAGPGPALSASATVVTQGVGLTATMVRMADYLVSQQLPSGMWVANTGGFTENLWWLTDFNGVGSHPASTAYNIMGLRRVYEMTGDTVYRDVITRAASALVTLPYTQNHSVVLHELIGLAFAQPLILSPTLTAQTAARAAELAAYLRANQNPDGGWGRGEGGVITPSDPLPTAGVLYALSLLQPNSVDPALTAAARYLIAQQRVDGQWSSIFSTNNARPILTTSWVDIALPYIYDVLSSYSVSVTHWVPISGVTVIDASVNPSASVSSSSGEATYGWAYNQAPNVPLQTLSHAANLTGMRPGETRQVTNGTVVSYLIESGSNVVRLAPRFVTAGHLVAVAPGERTSAPGEVVTFTVTLANPSSAGDVYTLSLSGLSDQVVSGLPLTMVIPAAGSAALVVSVTLPATARIGDAPFIVQAINRGGGADQAGAVIHVIDPFDIAVLPARRIASAGGQVTYTMVITNNELVTRSYALSSTGLAGDVLDMPQVITVNPAERASVLFTVTALNTTPIQLFRILTAEPVSGLTRGADAALDVIGRQGVTAAISPASVTTAPQMAIRLSAVITNTGDLSDTYDLSLQLPAGWSSAIQANGVGITALQLPAMALNTMRLYLVITPALASAGGTGAVSLTAQSRTNAGVSAVVTASVIVRAPGLALRIAPQSAHAAPTVTSTWQVLVTNTGSVVGTFVLTPSGFGAANATLSPASPAIVTLGPGQATQVVMTIGASPFALPGPHSFGVIGALQSSPDILAQDSATLIIDGARAIQTSIGPALVNLTSTLGVGTYMLLITNTGDLADDYLVTPGLARSDGALTVIAETNHVFIPAHFSGAVLFTAQSILPGDFAVVAQVSSMRGVASSSSQAVLRIAGALPTATPTATATPSPTQTPTATPGHRQFVVDLPLVQR